MNYYRVIYAVISMPSTPGDIIHVTREVDGDFGPSAITRRDGSSPLPAVP